MEKLPKLFTKLSRSLWSQPSIITQTRVWDPERYLDVVSDEDPSEVKNLQHGGRVVVHDAVALQDVLRSRDLPGEPAEVKGGIAGQQVEQVTWFAAAATSVILIALCDGFHLPLLAVGSWQSNKHDGSCKEVVG